MTEDEISRVQKNTLKYSQTTSSRINKRDLKFTCTTKLWISTIGLIVTKMVGMRALSIKCKTG